MSRDHNNVRKFKMVKVYLPSFAICTLSLSINFLILAINPLSAIAQESKPNQSSTQAANVASSTIEPEILSEINRVRTNPQGYAYWLEDQKQYYDRIWLKLPGEEPIRAHRLEKAINEAIAILKEQEPLPPLNSSDKTVANATKKLENFATTNQNIQDISYGRITPKGIVMGLVVDDLFPDRRRRKSLLSPNASDTGVVCKSDPRYDQICAISYSNSVVDDGTEEQPKTPVVSEEPTVASVPETSPPPKEEPEIAPPEVAPSIEEEKDVVTNDIPENIPDNSETEPEDTKVTAETLPPPPQPQTPPSVPQPPEPVEETPVVEDEKNNEIARANVEGIENETAEVEEVENEDEEMEAEILEEENKEESAEDIDNEKEEVFEAEEDDEAEQVAVNSHSSRLLENVERGTLEEGDRIIEEDGSFYDSYPLEGRSGESFTIALESDEFDAFVALIDAKGNIIEQNDDIDEENSNSRIRVNIPENGIYNVIVNAYDEGGKGDYILTISR